MEWSELKTDKILGYAFNYPKHRFLCCMTTKTGKHMVAKPLGVTLNITGKCNLRCKMCGIWARDIERDDELSEVDILQLISDMKKWGINRISFSGGEPLLRKDIVFKILSLCQKYGIETGMVTNGWLLDEKTADELISLGISRISISIDGMGKTHDNIRGVNGSFNRAIEAINNINRSKEKLGKKCVIHTNTVITNENLDELIALTDMARNHNSVIWFQAYDTGGISAKGKKDPLWIPEDRLNKLNEIIDKIIVIKRREKSVIGNPTKELKSIKTYFKNYNIERNECYAAFDNISIDSFGNVLPCWHWKSVGNIKDKDIRSIWNSDIYRKAIIDMQKCDNPCLLNCHFTPGSLDSLLYDMIYLPILRKMSKEKKNSNS